MKSVFTKISRLIKSTVLIHSFLSVISVTITGAVIATLLFLFPQISRLKLLEVLPLLITIILILIFAVSFLYLALKAVSIDMEALKNPKQE